MYYLFGQALAYLIPRLVGFKPLTDAARNFTPPLLRGWIREKEPHKIASNDGEEGGKEEMEIR
jgi:hypothetical protein